MAQKWEKSFLTLVDLQKFFSLTTGSIFLTERCMESDYTDVKTQQVTLKIPKKFLGNKLRLRLFDFTFFYLFMALSLIFTNWHDSPAERSSEATNFLFTFLPLYILRSLLQAIVNVTIIYPRLKSQT